MKKVDIMLDEYPTAEDGAILARKNGKWTPVRIEELIADYEKRLKALEKLPNDFAILTQNNKHFIDYAKSHFIVVFNLFLNLIELGDIDITGNEELLDLGYEVINDKISVKDAIEKHPFLKRAFTSLYLEKNEYKHFPEV